MAKYSGWCSIYPRRSGWPASVEFASPTTALAQAFPSRSQLQARLVWVGSRQGKLPTQSLRMCKQLRKTFYRSTAHFRASKCFLSRGSTILRWQTKSHSIHFSVHLRRLRYISKPPSSPTSHTALLQHCPKWHLQPLVLSWLPFQYQQAGLLFLRSAYMRSTLPPTGVVMSVVCHWVPNLAVNTDAPRAALRARRGSPVTLIR